LSLKEREFVEAALSLGASDRRVMFVEILPNVMGRVIVYTSLLIRLYELERGVSRSYC
jgi:peptide/nickel transport system permease protein